jgi:hypothetical protein
MDAVVEVATKYEVSALPEKNPFPLTERVVNGVVDPIPILPSLSIVKAARDVVANVVGEAVSM